MAVKLFNADFYRTNNPDLANLEDAQALSHFQTYGLNEGRAFSPFVDLNYYKSSFGDLTSLSKQQALDHLQTYGIAEGRATSSSFDVGFYLSHNSDLKAAGLNYTQAFEHYISYGQAEKRAGSDNGLEPSLFKKISPGLSGSSPANFSDVNGTVYGHLRHRQL